jgi:hypothetical protein
MAPEYAKIPVSLENERNGFPNQEGSSEMRRFATILPLALLLSACAGGAPPEPPPPPPFNPAGVYDCFLEVEGMDLTAVLTLTETEAGYEGSVDTDMGFMQLSDIVLEGQEMTFVVDTPDMAVFFSVVFDGDTMTGDFDAGGSPGIVTGTKR